MLNPTFWAIFKHCAIALALQHFKAPLQYASCHDPLKMHLLTKPNFEVFWVEEWSISFSVHTLLENHKLSPKIRDFVKITASTNN